MQARCHFLLFPNLRWLSIPPVFDNEMIREDNPIFWNLPNSEITASAVAYFNI